MICAVHIASAAIQAHYAQDKAAAARERGDEAEAAWWDRVRRDVDQAPSLTHAQRDRLAVLLRCRDSAPPPRTRRAKSPDGT